MTNHAAGPMLKAYNTGINTIIVIQNEVDDFALVSLSTITCRSLMAFLYWYSQDQAVAAGLS
ncbi:MAG: hypothetical protein ACKVT0_19425 [Planctomycetaceae bacterium]